MKQTKYKSKKIIIDGITFASKDEGKYYEYLKQLKAENKILSFELQPKFTIIPKFKYQGKSEREATYTLDFTVYKLDGTIEYTDIKGMSTQQGELKFKLLKYQHPELNFKWIARSLKYGQDGWIDYKELQKIRRDNKKLC